MPKNYRKLRWTLKQIFCWFQMGNLLFCTGLRFQGFPSVSFLCLGGISASMNVLSCFSAEAPPTRRSSGSWLIGRKDGTTSIYPRCDRLLGDGNAHHGVEEA